jgi:flagellar biosynthesis GTPase FlhF
MVKKALVIGINYTGSQHALRGCINDAWNVANFLVNHWGYQPGDILVLTDDPTSKPIGGTRVSTTREEHAETHAAEHHEAEPEKKKKDKKDKKDKKKKDEAHEESDEKKDKKKEKKDKKDKKDKKKDKTRDISPEELQALDDSYAAATRDINEEEVITRGATSATFLRGKCDRAGILEGIHYLTNNLSAGDHLFLHYSGHGTQVADRTGDGKLQL